jgi:phage tail sheath protein FI
VRVTDGTDAAATSAGVTSCITFTALYTGTLGNSIVVTLAAGQLAGTWNATVGIPGYPAEFYPGISGSGNAFWVNLAAAINNGVANVRGPSNIVVAAAGAGTTAASALTMPAFTGGLDGASGVAAATLVGTDSSTGGARVGSYALRSQGVSILDICDMSTASQFSAVDGLAQSEAMYAIQVLPLSTSISAAVTAVQGVGLNSYTSKVLHGDWIYWNDPVNGLLRLVSPQAFAAGKLAALTPNQSSANKALIGVVGSQKTGIAGTGQLQSYSSADLSTLFAAGIDVITNPGAGGLSIWTVRGGLNSSANASINGDNYTRMTNYIASTLNAGMGVYEGQPITPTLLSNIRTTVLAYLAGLLTQGLLSPNGDGSVPYGVVCNATNNPQARTALGYTQCDVQVTYQGINRFMLVNLQGGTTVVTIQSNVQSN